ncbi:uncharacterized protein A4U43_C03F19780 [Asparagus officinalis]|uniref:Uncharacterized protein n=1 Tax=Asparagus officinalis TaxID=4686 RepID=A0A5P1FCF6_ASPOF|nr:uncharacterized protein A4U43_C03F19780 [Asparagus officinalis]
MVNGGKINSWACVNFSRNLRPDEVYWFCQSLFGVCNNIGMVVHISFFGIGFITVYVGIFAHLLCISILSREPVIKILFEHADNVEIALRNVHAKATAALRGGTLKLLLVVMPETSGSYGKIKRVCETELGLVSQCCLPEHKRHHIRLFPEFHASNPAGNKSRNILPVPPAYYAHLASFWARCYVESNSDGGSATVGGTCVENAEVRPMPKIKSNVKLSVLLLEGYSFLLLFIKTVDSVSRYEEYIYTSMDHLIKRQSIDIANL